MQIDNFDDCLTFDNELKYSPKLLLSKIKKNMILKMT